MKTSEAIAIMGLSEMPDMDGLRLAYKARVRQVHPDLGGDNDQFIDVQSAYEILADQVVHRLKKTAMTIEGYPLTDLGKGLSDANGKPLNGKACQACQGKGYSEYTRTTYCRSCRPKHSMIGDHLGYEYRCQWCEGSGETTLGDGHQASTSMPCIHCDGVGWHFSYNKRNSCSVCHGSQRIPVGHECSICARCGGTGEIEVWNPVLPKHRL